MATYQCIVCGKEKKAIPSRLGKAKFCSHACRGEWRSKNWLGDKHPGWLGGIREKQCQYCGATFSLKPRQPITTFRTQKFCSKACADKGGIRYEGDAHPLWKANSRTKDRRGKHGSWARAVIARDLAICQNCGISGVELHAHHIKPYAKFPELRWEIGNGLTLCYKCHWAMHTASTANRVNSENLLPRSGGENPEPSFGRKPVEGVTTRGRAYRRWNGSCEWCGVFISKRWSDAVGKNHLFCSKHCSGKYNPRIATIADGKIHQRSRQ